MGQMAATVLRGERLHYAEVSGRRLGSASDAGLSTSGVCQRQACCVPMPRQSRSHFSPHRSQGFVVPVCCTCGKQASGGHLLRCAKCRTAGYCSKECQRRQWGQHKKARAAGGACACRVCRAALLSAQVAAALCWPHWEGTRHARPCAVQACCLTV